MATVNTSDNRYGVAQFIVAPTIAQGANYTTITSAIATAVSGQTIFIRPGTYTENFTLPAGVNLTAFDCDASTPNVTIVGKITCTDAGRRTITGVTLQSNSDNILAVTGSAATNIDFFRCVFQVSGATGISYTSSSSSSLINFSTCVFFVNSNNALFVSTSAGNMAFYYCLSDTTGWTGAQSTVSTGLVAFSFSSMVLALATSSTGIFQIDNSSINAGAPNVTALTLAGTGTSLATRSAFISGSASAISVGSGTTLRAIACSAICTNTNIVTGAGTFEYSCFSNSSATGVFNQTSTTFDRFFVGDMYGKTITLNTFASGIAAQQVSLSDTGGQYRGFNTNTAPPAGFLGEQIRGFAASGSIGSFVNNTFKTITSITLTPGVWDVNYNCRFSGGAITGTATFSGIATATNSSTGYVDGDNSYALTIVPSAVGDITHTVSQYRILVSANTSYFLTAALTFSGGTPLAGGRLSAVRVG